ncbi:Hypothetical_protein [Hexamita inflata]|uniref:Hypothetical_protein n=1 Tax=Hexamita inflata TaxID=28002 RepID=A0AA86PYB8_9EUKA|nr:Hypothetical protein HINF_LOCUS30847 [Hexamita inflata]
MKQKNSVYAKNIQKIYFRIAIVWIFQNIAGDQADLVFASLIIVILFQQITQHVLKNALKIKFLHNSFVRRAKPVKFQTWINLLVLKNVKQAFSIQQERFALSFVQMDIILIIIIVNASLVLILIRIVFGILRVNNVNAMSKPLGIFQIVVYVFRGKYRTNIKLNVLSRTAVHSF